MLLVTTNRNVRFFSKKAMLKDREKNIKNYSKIGRLNFSNFLRLTARIPRPVRRGRSLTISTRKMILLEHFQSTELFAKQY